VFEFWFSFNGLLDGSGYLKNLEDSTQYYNNDELNIISIKNGLTEIGLIYYSYLKNTFRFKINGTDNLEAYVPVRNLNNSFYIVASYLGGTLKISANGEEGGRGSVSDTSLFPNKNSSSIYFNINGTSLVSSASMNYVIGDLAIYDMAITSQDQRKRVLHGLSADKPSQITSVLETSYFDFSEKDYHSIYNDVMMGAGFQNNIFNSNNLVFSDGDGISYKIVDDFQMLESAYTGSAIATSSGSKFLNTNTALVLNQYGTMFGDSAYQTISCQITPTTASTSYIFSIENCVNNKDSLYVTAGSAGFSIGSYDHFNASATEYFNVAKSLTVSQQYDFAISIDGEEICIYSDDSSDTTTIPNLDIKNSSRLILGNLSDTFTNNTLYIKNLGMNNEKETTFTGFDLTENKMFMARLTSNFSISQLSTWSKVIPIANYHNEIVGSKITWDGMDNCLVETSVNDQDWQTVTRGEPIPNLLYDRPNKNQLIRVNVPYEYKIEKNNQSFNNLEIMLYRNLSFVSDDGDYTFSASSDSASHASYTIKRLPQSILLRQDKFGLYFPKTNEIARGYGVVNSASGLSLTYAADFWLKFDSFSTASNFVISRNNSPSVQYVYVDATTKKFIFTSNVKLYINGASVTNNNFTASTGTYYHLFCDFQTSGSTAVYINGKYDGSASVHSHGSYGHLNIWSSSVTAATASSRYAHFVSNNITTVSDSTASLLWQPSWNTDAITTASGYRIG